MQNGLVCGEILITQQRDNDTEQTGTFNQRGGDNHVGLDFASGFGVTSNSFHGATANQANTDTNADNGQTCSKCCNTSGHHDTRGI